MSFLSEAELLESAWKLSVAGRYAIDATTAADLLSMRSGNTASHLNTTSILRHINAARCLRLLKRSEIMSRADIARQLNVTRTTVGNAIKVIGWTNPLEARF